MTTIFTYRDFMETVKRHPQYPISVSRDGSSVKTLDALVSSFKGKRLYAGRECVIRKNKSGYPCVQFRLDNKIKHKFVHVLVLETFSPKPEGKWEVNHIDGDKLNNRLENLEWTTRTGNIVHAISKGLRTYKKKDECIHSKLTEIRASQIKSRFLAGESRDSIHEDFKEISRSTLNKVIRGDSWK